MEKKLLDIDLIGAIKKRIAEVKAEDQLDIQYKLKSLEALWRIKNLLEEQNPPKEKASYTKFTIGSSLVTDEEVKQSGDFLCYQSYTRDTGARQEEVVPTQPIIIRLNEPSAPQIFLFPSDYIQAPFDRFFFTKQWHNPNYSPQFLIGRNIIFDISQRDFSFAPDSAGSTLSLRPALIDSDRHVQVDVLTAPTITITGTVTTAHGKTLQSAEIDHAGAGANTIITATADQQIYVYAIAFNVSGTVTVELRNGATPVSGQFNLQTREGLTWSVTPPAYLFECSTNTAFIMFTSGAIAMDGIVSYWKE